MATSNEHTEIYSQFSDAGYFGTTPPSKASFNKIIEGARRFAVGNVGFAALEAKKLATKATATARDISLVSFFGLFTYVFLVFGLYHALTLAMPAYASALIVAGVHGLVAAIFFTKLKKRFTSDQPAHSVDRVTSLVKSIKADARKPETVEEAKAEIYAGKMEMIEASHDLKVSAEQAIDPKYHIQKNPLPAVFGGLAVGALVAWGLTHAPRAKSQQDYN